MDMHNDILDFICMKFCNKQNQSNGRRILNAWSDMDEEMKNEIRIAMKTALEAYREYY
jgi:hypothetical protein